VDPLIRAHIDAKERLQRLAALAAATAWDNLPHYDRANVDQFLSTVLPYLAGANLQSVALTEAYLARALERQPVGVDAAAIVAGIRNGTTPEQLYLRPFVTVWSALKARTPFDEAVKLGRDRATTAAATDVQLAFRDTLPAVGAADTRIMGYARVANASACSFCQSIDGAQFRKSDPAPLHAHCACGVRVIEYTRGRHFEPTTIPDTVAVHQHGELGPVLGDPSHDFLTEHEALAR
jgi:hypothetical protein